MVRALLMAVRSIPGGDLESEPVIVTLDDEGRLELVLDDGQRLELDYDELLAAVLGETDSAAAALREAS